MTDIIISIVSAILIASGIAAIIFRQRLIFLEEFGKQIGVAVGVLLILSGLFTFMYFGNIINA